MQQKLILYTYFRSSTSHRVRIAMNLKKINYEPRFINLRDGEQKDPKYAEINPNQAVPALQLDNGTILIESMAIMEYLEETYPEGKLLPKDSVKRAQIRGICEVINSGIHPYHNLRMFEWVEAVAPKFDRVAFAHTMLVREFGGLEKILKGFKGKYCVGDEITLADVLLVPQVMGAIARFKLDLNDYPRIKEIYENLKDIPEFYKAQPDQQPDFQK